MQEYWEKNFLDIKCLNNEVPINMTIPLKKSQKSKQQRKGKQNFLSHGAN